MKSRAPYWQDVWDLYLLEVYGRVPLPVLERYMARVPLWPDVPFAVAARELLGDAWDAWMVWSAARRGAMPDGWGTDLTRWPSGLPEPPPEPPGLWDRCSACSETDAPEADAACFVLVMLAHARTIRGDEAHAVQEFDADLFFN